MAFSVRFLKIDPAAGFIRTHAALCHLTVHSADKDLYLSFFISAVQGCGKRLLAEIVALAKSEGYQSLYLWTDSSCNHSYYAHHGFEMVAEFKSDEWMTDSDDYLTYIYRKSF